jgi:hypothetical protein
MLYIDFDEAFIAPPVGIKSSVGYRSPSDDLRESLSALQREYAKAVMRSGKD